MHDYCYNLQSNYTCFKFYLSNDFDVGDKRELNRTIQKQAELNELLNRSLSKGDVTLPYCFVTGTRCRDPRMPSFMQKKSIHNIGLV